jgi:hypothetical protein
MSNGLPHGDNATACARHCLLVRDVSIPQDTRTDFPILAAWDALVSSERCHNDKSGLVPVWLNAGNYTLPLPSREIGRDVDIDRDRDIKIETLSKDSTVSMILFVFIGQ